MALCFIEHLNCIVTDFGPLARGQKGGGAQMHALQNPQTIKSLAVIMTLTAFRLTSSDCQNQSGGQLNK